MTRFAEKLCLYIEWTTIKRTPRAAHYWRARKMRHSGDFFEHPLISQQDRGGVKGWVSRRYRGGCGSCLSPFVDALSKLPARLTNIVNALGQRHHQCQWQHHATPFRFSLRKPHSSPSLGTLLKLSWKFSLYFFLFFVCGTDRRERPAIILLAPGEEDGHQFP